MSTITETDLAILDMVGNRRVTITQLVEEGACMVVNGMTENVRHRLDKLVKAGLLRKVKLQQGRRGGGCAAVRFEQAAVCL